LTPGMAGPNRSGLTTSSRNSSNSSNSNDGFHCRWGGSANAN
jgi:hypothetical protein